MIEERVKAIVCEALKIAPEAYREDLGAGDVPEWDSLAHVGLLMAIEREFDITLDVGDAIGIETVGDIIVTIQQYLGDIGRKTT